MGMDRKKKLKVVDDLHMSAEENARILRKIEQEESDVDYSKSDSSSETDIVAKSSSVSDQFLLNICGEFPTEDVICSTNYLRFVSDKVSAKFDFLQVIDKNERQFKQVAENMITQSS